MKSQVLSIALLFISGQWSVSASLFSEEKAHIETVDAESLGGLRGSSNKEPITQSSDEQGEEDSSRDHRIIGGTEATPNKYSFAVSLSDSKGHFCGGSLITKNVVLTAAHCAGGQYSAILGRHDLRSRNDGQEISMKKEIPHPNYDDWTTDNDFMLVVLSSPAILSSDVQLVDLNSANSEPSVGDQVTVMGWGDTDISSASRLSDVLMHVKVKCISNDECDASTDGRDSYKDQITQNMLCAEHRQAKDSCQGDSGGPLVEEARGVVKQVGVVSWGIGCASDHFPGVYARVSKAFNWIERQVCNENEQYASEAGFDCANASPASTSSVPAPVPAPAPSRPVPAPSPSWSFGSYWQPSPSSGSSGQGIYPSLYYDDDAYWDDDWRRE